MRLIVVDRALDSDDVPDSALDLAVLKHLALIKAGFLAEPLRRDRRSRSQSTSEESCSTSPGPTRMDKQASAGTQAPTGEGTTPARKRTSAENASSGTFGTEIHCRSLQTLYPHMTIRNPWTRA